MAYTTEARNSCMSDNEMQDLSDRLIAALTEQNKFDHDSLWGELRRLRTSVELLERDSEERIDTARREADDIVEKHRDMITKLTIKFDRFWIIISVIVVWDHQEEIGEWVKMLIGLMK